MNGQVT
ncbi:unnamed protein product, partial [Rotaria sp. Silwood1]